MQEVTTKEIIASERASAFEVGKGSQRRSRTISDLTFFLTPFHRWATGVRAFFLAAISFLAVCGIMLLLYFIEGYSPFGEQSLAVMDASIQYLDLFSYAKDVLSGDNSFFYTMSKELGSTGVAMWSYYLASPFTLLVAFFDKADLLIYFDLTVALKVGTAAITMTFFMQKRFSGALHPILVVLLSMSYALGQYSIAQSSNIMWLDGVYMLPLMLLGVYELINKKRHAFFIVATGLALLFNWYTGCINCLFTFIWFCLEIVLIRSKARDGTRSSFRTIVRAFIGYLVSLICGVALSACLFLPSLVALSSGDRGVIDWDILNPFFNGDVINVIQGFVLGAASDGEDTTVVSLWCGSLALLGAIGFFAVGRRSRSQKIAVGIILIVCILIFYWQPFFALFSLLKDASSYWFRYSYVTIFLLVFLAADCYSFMRKRAKHVRISVGSESFSGERNNGKRQRYKPHYRLQQSTSRMFQWRSQAWLLISAVVLSVVLILFSIADPLPSSPNVWLTCLFLIIVALIVSGFFQSLFNGRKVAKGVISCLLIVVVSIELACNTDLLIKSYHEKTPEAYSSYSAAEQTQINEIRSSDPGLYRISQTSTFRFEKDTYLISNYDEALAYDYWSISSYTSAPSGNQKSFLSALGYRSNGDNMNIVDTSLLPADSLLGVKYVLLPYAIKGLEKIDTFSTENDKDVYYNPYALPLAFTYTSDSESDLQPSNSHNPFDYQNALYSQLLGEQTQLYIPVDFTVSDDGDERTYDLELPEGNYAFYGNIRWNHNMNAMLDVNGFYETGYSRWLSPSAFYIPAEDGATAAKVTLTYEVEAITDEQFVALDLDELARVTDALKERSPESYFLDNGEGSFTVENAEEGQDLLVTLPLSDGWNITVNGNKVAADTFANCLVSIPLDEGENVIEMKYTVPGLNAGIVISLVAVIAVVGEVVYRRRAKLNPQVRKRSLRK